MKFSSKAVHVGQKPDSETGAMIPPIYMTSTFFQESPGQTKGYDYTRGGNPNFTRLEEQLASLEEAQFATVFSSGLGAVTGFLSTLEQGDRVVAIEGLYGGTYRLFTRVFGKFGLKFTFVNGKKIEDVKKALESKPKWLFFETPTNPLLELHDISALTALARQNGVKTIVDNTFATPYFQNPLQHGADAILHSTTKYIGGHSDVIGGVIMTNDKALKEGLDFGRMAIGLNPSPFDVWLTSRGVKTLAVRMERHQQNAMALARYLEKHEKVKKVYYPGLESHPDFEIARKQMRGYSGVVSVEFNVSLEETANLIKSLKLFSLGESLGGVESLVCHPATMTHASIPKSEREKMGLTDALVRFSAGIEDSDDIINDLKHTL